MADDNGFILKVSNLGAKLQNQTLLDHVSFNVTKGTTLTISGSKVSFGVPFPGPMVVFVGIAIFAATVVIN